jgi:TAG lipase/steryl ester hydrolase/phospholipase A2/LPA acyltransferase
LGVISALHRESLLPRIVCGTSAGSIVAATVCVKNDEEIARLFADRGAINLLRNLRFFGLRRGESSTDLAKASANYLFAHQTGRSLPGAPQSQGDDGELGASVEWDLRRGRQHMKTTHNLLDSSVLQQTIFELIGGDVTFLEAFDRTGRVLNITVTRSDGKAPPLLCNYLTTPHLLVHSASLASCAIPGVFEAVELMCKGRNGETEPYFKTGGWRWTDGGLQADLPKERLTELFNVNQFIVSQVYQRAGPRARTLSLLPLTVEFESYWRQQPACAALRACGRNGLPVARGVQRLPQAPAGRLRTRRLQARPGQAVPPRRLPRRRPDYAGL